MDLLKRATDVYNDKIKQCMWLPQLLKDDEDDLDEDDSSSHNSAVMLQ